MASSASLSSSNLAASTSVPLSKNARKRLAKTEKFREKKRLKKEAKKKAKAEARKAAPIPTTTTSVRPTDGIDHKARRAKEKAERIHTFLTAAAAAPQVIIDLDFEEQMNEKEKKSMVQQLMYCYGMNKRATHPLGMHFAGLRGETEEMLDNIGGFRQWLGVTVSSTPYEQDDTFDKKSLVYLTADSNNVLESFDSNKKYIIGGIVDRNRLKNATYLKAQQQQIETAQLPIQKYCKLSTSKVLTINHVFDIMLQRLATGSWRDAFLKGIPSRKDLQLREEFVAPQKSSTSSSSTSISSTSSSSTSISSTSASSLLPRPTVLIIGGSSGIGKGFLTKFVQQNYNIIISSRSESKLSSVCSEIKRTNPTACLKYFVCDCTSVSDCDNLYKYVVEQWGQTERGNIIVHSAGDFKWDTDAEFKSTKSTTTSSTTASATATTTTKEYLYSSNVLTKMNVFKSCAPLLQHIDSKFIVIGSQAGQPSFKEEMEKKEGKGAVDNEAGYMFAMATLAKWTKTIPNAVLLEPGLVKTQMAEREFGHISGIPWDKVPTPDEYAESCWASVVCE